MLRWAMLVALKTALVKTTKDAIRMYRTMNRQYKEIAKYLSKAWVCKLRSHDWQYVSEGIPLREPTYRLCPLCLEQQVYRIGALGWYYDRITHDESVKWSSMRAHILREYRKKMEVK